MTGSYGLHDKDGRMRVVHYKADKRGFRAVIKTNEPGKREFERNCDSFCKLIH